MPGCAALARGASHDVVDDLDPVAWAHLCTSVLHGLGVGVVVCTAEGVLRAATPLGHVLAASVDARETIELEAPLPRPLADLIRAYDTHGTSRARVTCRDDTALRVTIFSGAPLAAHALALRLERDRDADALASLRSRFRLTVRDLQVVVRIGRGQSNRTIAEALGLSEGTVKNYVHRVYEIVGVRSRTQLVALLDEIRSESTGPDSSD